MRFVLFLLLLAGAPVHAADAPYLDDYDLPEGISGWDAMDVCGRYGVATSMAMLLKRDGQEAGETTRSVLDTVGGNKRTSDNPVTATISSIVEVVYENRLPAVEMYTVESEVKERCLRSNGLKE